MPDQSFFSRGWDFAATHPVAICPDVAPIVSVLPLPAWSVGEWFDGFLAEREAAYKRHLSQELKADCGLPSRESVMRKKG